MILAGDVGGTKVHLALYDFKDGKLDYSRDEKYAAKEHAGLEEIVKLFLGEAKVDAACFGVPGPVRNGRLRLTNLPWTLDSKELSASLGITHVFLINDLEANGYGVAELSADQIYTLAEGDASQIGNRALIAAGTGLGEGLLIWNGHTHVPYPSEGGHADYAASKGALISLTKSLSSELAPHGIYANCVAPGWTHTEMTGSVFDSPADAARTNPTIPVGRPAHVTEIAGPILFLCTPYAGFISGEIFNVNGGAVLTG